MTLLIIEDDVKRPPLSVMAAASGVESTFRPIAAKTYELARAQGIGTDIKLQRAPINLLFPAARPRGIASSAASESVGPQVDTRQEGRLLPAFLFLNRV